jgi:hypothetical protein
MEDDQDTFAPWDAAALVVSGGIRGVRPVVGRRHVPQRRERFQRFAHIGPVGTLRKHVFTSLRARWTCWATGSTVSGVALLGGAGELPALNEGVDGHRGSALHRTQGTSTKAAAITYAHRPRGSMRSIQETESSPPPSLRLACCTGVPPKPPFPRRTTLWSNAVLQGRRRLLPDEALILSLQT